MVRRPSADSVVALTDARYEQLSAQFHSNASYSLLNGDKQGIGGKAKWTNDEVLSEYASDTQRLIDVLAGIDLERKYLEKVDGVKIAITDAPDIVIFLDKSARPVSWLVRALWSQMAGSSSKKPQHMFMAVDRVNWFRRQGYDDIDKNGLATDRFGQFKRLGPDDFDISEIKDSDITGIRALFSTDTIVAESDVWKSATFLDGKDILVVDEVGSSGSSVHIAAQLLRRAIPEIKTISGEYFWNTGYNGIRQGELQMSSAPVWYDSSDDDHPKGRGVSRLSPAYYEAHYLHTSTSNNLKRKMGSIVLSAPHHFVGDPLGVSKEPEVVAARAQAIRDTRAEALRIDIKQLAHDVSQGRILVKPDINRVPLELAIQRAKTQGFTSIQEMIKFIGRREEKDPA